MVTQNIYAVCKNYQYKYITHNVLCVSSHFHFWSAITYQSQHHRYVKNEIIMQHSICHLCTSQCQCGLLYLSLPLMLLEELSPRSQAVHFFQPKWKQFYLCSLFCYINPTTCNLFFSSEKDMCMHLIPILNKVKEIIHSVLFPAKTSIKQ